MNRSSIFFVLAVVWLCDVSRAFAQFGLEDDSAIVETVPATTDTSIQSLNSSSLVASEPLKLREAIATFREYQAAYLKNDTEYFLAVLGEPEKSTAREKIQQRGLNHYVNHDTEIVTWALKCGACYEDAERGQICTLIDKRHIPSEHNNKSYSSIYIIEKNGEFATISKKQSHFRGPGYKLKKKQKKNNRNCKLSQYDLAIGAPSDAPNGLQSLFRGMGAVMRRLQD